MTVQAWAAWLLLLAGGSPSTLRPGAPQEPVPDEREALMRDFERFQAAVDAEQWDQAESLGRDLLARSRASWSVNNLAILWTRLGRYARAEALLDEELERLAGLEDAWSAELVRARSAGQGEAEEQARSTLDWLGAEHTVVLERRGLLAQAIGDERRARRFLGAALARGGRDAAQILGHAALVEGRFSEARALFRSLLLPREDESFEDLLQIAPWALRGWGLSLLPEARSGAPPVPRGASGATPRNPPPLED